MYLLRLIVLKCSFTLLSILTVFVMMLLSTKCIANEVKVNENLVYASVQAALWLCEDYPLSLQEQIMPIVDLLAISNTHFQERERKTLHNIEKCMIAYDRYCCLSTFFGVYTRHRHNYTLALSENCRIIVECRMNNLHWVVNDK